VVEIETDQLCSVVIADGSRQMFVGSEQECKDYLNNNKYVDPAVARRGGLKLLKTAKVMVARDTEESLKEDIIIYKKGVFTPGEGGEGFVGYYNPNYN
jgi:hypothetical protein